jgi:hypothetical protein
MMRTQSGSRLSAPFRSQLGEIRADIALRVGPIEQRFSALARRTLRKPRRAMFEAI